MSLFTAQSGLSFPASLSEKYRPHSLQDFVGLEKPKKVLAKFADSPLPKRCVSVRGSVWHRQDFDGFSTLRGYPRGTASHSKRTLQRRNGGRYRSPVSLRPSQNTLQKQPCATKDDVERAIKNAPSHQEQLFYALLAGAGLRVAEALSIHVTGTEDQTSWNQVSATISVCSSIYNGAEQHRVKTPAANRVTDLDPRLNAAIAKFVAEQNVQPGAFLFQSRSGRAMHLRTATARLEKHGIPGFHSLRRHRITRLRDLGVPEDIVRCWVGHAGEGITDRYSELVENASFARSGGPRRSRI